MFVKKKISIDKEIIIYCQPEHKSLEIVVKFPGEALLVLFCMIFCDPLIYLGTRSERQRLTVLGK